MAAGRVHADSMKAAGVDSEDLHELNKIVAESQFVGESEKAFSERNTPSGPLPRVAHRWDIPPLDERTAETSQILEGVRSRIVTTPAGEPVLWGNRQATVVLEVAVAQLTQRRSYIDGATLSAKSLGTVIELIRRVEERVPTGARHLSDFATNLETLLSGAKGGVIGYVDADDTRTDAEVRMLEMHEVGVHLPQARLGKGSIKILPAAWMRGDPDYRQIAQSEVGRAYVREPKRLAGEAAAYVLSGEWDKLGYTGDDALKRALGFADRYLREVNRIYGVEAVKEFRDIRPEMSAVVERIVNESSNNSPGTPGAKTRNTGGVGEPDGGSFARSDRARSIGERARQDLGGGLRAGWGGGGEESARGASARVGEAESLTEPKDATRNLAPKENISQTLKGRNESSPEPVAALDNPTKIKTERIPEFARIRIDPDSLSNQWKSQTTGFDQNQDIGVSLDNIRLAFKTDRANPQAGVLYINSHVMHFFSWFYEKATEGKIKLDHSMLTTPRDGADAVRQALTDNIGFFRSMGLTNSQANNLQITILTIDDALKRGVQSLSFINVDYPKHQREVAEAHEVFHGWQYLIESNSGRPHVSGEWIEKQPGFDKVSRWLADHNNPTNTEYVGREWAAYAATDDLVRLGFTREETRTFLTRYFDRVVEEHGADVLEKIGRVSVDARAIINDLKTQITTEKQKGERNGQEREGTGDGTEDFKYMKLEIDARHNDQQNAGRRIDGGPILEKPIGAGQPGGWRRSGGGDHPQIDAGLPGEGIKQPASFGLVESGPTITTSDFEHQLLPQPEGKITSPSDASLAKNLDRTDGRTYENGQSAPRIPFIEEALAAGANVDYISIHSNGSDWTIVSFENARGTYLLKGDDVYVTRASVEELQSSIKADPINLPGIKDISRPGDIVVEVPDVSFYQVIDSMKPNNREILQGALAEGAVVDRFWSKGSWENPERSTMTVVSFENTPGTYIFRNGEGEDWASRTQLDFGATRYALDFGYRIGDISSVSEIRVGANKVEPRGRDLDYSLSL